MAVQIDDRGRVEAVVDASMTAAAMGSGLVQGLSTPTMIALMEAAAVEALTSSLEPGTSSVGTRVDVRHLAPTPVGMRVVAEALVVEVDGRRVVLAVSAADECGPIGEGTHERFVINTASFADRLSERSMPKA
ncbi:MAG: thioesterase family protein [Thermoleophilia bacterium]